MNRLQIVSIPLMLFVGTTGVQWANHQPINLNEAAIVTIFGTLVILVIIRIIGRRST